MEELFRQQVEKVKCVVKALLFAGIVCGILSLLWGCKQVEYVPIETVRIDTLIKTKIEKENVYIHDSSSTEKKGDTLFIEHWHTQWRDREVHDTIYQSKIDSVPKPYPKTEYVEKELTWWQKLRLSIANIVLWIIVIVGGFKIYKLIKR